MRKQKEKIYKFYLKHARCVNNWDLVDTSAPKIVGAYLRDREVKVGFIQARAVKKSLGAAHHSRHLRLYLLRETARDTSHSIAAELVRDDHDLIHKAGRVDASEVG